MRRIRIALLLVSAATLALVAALAWRAQQGLVVERAVRHEAVAERAFEEMERELTRFLEREEGRPFEHYAFHLATSGERSPLAAGLEPFVVGAFQIDPQGALTTPLEPRDPEAARARGQWPPDAAMLEAIARVEEVANGLWSTNADAKRDEIAEEIVQAKPGPSDRDASLESQTQAPGTTRALAGPGIERRAAQSRADSAGEKKEQTSAFDVLESLNRAVDYRAERRQKVAQAPSAAVYGQSRDVPAATVSPSRASEIAESEQLAKSGAMADTEPLAGADVDRLGASATASEREAPVAVAKAGASQAAPGRRAADRSIRERAMLQAPPAPRPAAEEGASRPSSAEKQARANAEADDVFARSDAAADEAFGLSDAVVEEGFGPSHAASEADPQSSVAGSVAPFEAALAEPAAPPADPRASAPAPAEPESAGVRADRARPGATDAPAPQRAAGAPGDGRDTVRVTLDPMVGVATGDALVLYRTVLVGQRGFRQGLVLDRDALGAWLEERVIRASGLMRIAELRFDAAPSRPDSGARYLFAHRFAEPFDALHAQLALAPLPGVASPLALYALVLVLLAVGAAGLFAVHRTVAVTVAFAERRSNFVAAVTHELKTPLTAIRMYAEMLRDGLVPGDAKRQEYYATITDESERLSRLVDNVLEFSKLEGGRRDLAVAAGPIGPVLEEAVEKLRAHAAREGFELLVRTAPDLPAVRFDRDALLQVIFNLVDNAMKYAAASERRTVELEARREGEAVTVAVRDYGPGVSRGHLERVFEPFYRAESELTRSTKGTGIGLALVKELSERMGAVVSGANAEDGGFRVRLAFPVASKA